MIGVEPDRERYKYNTLELPGLEDLSGRVIVKFKRAFRASYINGSRYSESMIVSEILPERITVGDFPGFSKINLDFSRLKYILSREVYILEVRIAKCRWDLLHSR